MTPHPSPPHQRYQPTAAGTILRRRGRPVFHWPDVTSCTRTVGLLGLAIALATAACATRSTRIDPTRLAGVGSDWATVVGLRTGVQVRVELSSSGRVEGRLARADEHGLTLAHGDAVRAVARADVRRVITVGHRKTEKAGRGAIIGGVLGGALGLVAETNRAAWSAILAAGWGAVGALIGAADGFVDREEVVIYAAAANTIS